VRQPKKSTESRNCRKFFQISRLFSHENKGYRRDYFLAVTDLFQSSPGNIEKYYRKCIMRVRHRRSRKPFSPTANNASRMG
jgi:hypothetical protein